MTYSAIIPTLNPGLRLPALVAALHAQTEPPLEIIVIDSSSNDGTLHTAAALGCATLSIPRSDFSHGGTRNAAALAARGDILMFLTQDALPVDADFARELLRPLRDGRAVASHARQIAYPGASLRERLTRDFNYPNADSVRTGEDAARLGVGAYFFSNVASAVRVDVFRELGMFDPAVIMNEDMLFCAAALDAGLSVAYAARAKVFHSHDYGALQTFRRYFDVGVFFSRHFARPGLALHGRGKRYTLCLLGDLLRARAVKEFFGALVETGAKFLGYKLGRGERLFPVALKRKMSLHHGFWASDRFGERA